ncbi:WXG100 family type VII secretion target [Kutzneria sp. NPDC052558]|uniref:WXG100 family type VII secretion target n=1 Tax=Kutzneria sp. NPDC052558 TaxID=3364121 RepID=UPI0037C927B1
MSSLPVGQTDVLDEIYGTGSDVHATVTEIEQYSSEADDSGGGDPLNALISKGLGFVIDYIEPVKEALEFVTGSPDALNAAADTYSQLSADIDQLGSQLHDELISGFANWKGDASDTAHQEMAHFLDGIHGTATLAGYIVQLLKASASMMQAAKDIIIGIIADFVEQMLITWAAALATTIFTLGLSDAAATAATVTEAGVAVSKAGAEVSKVSKLIEKVGKLIEKIMQMIRKIAELLKKFAAKIQSMGGKLAKIGEDMAEGAGKVGKIVGKGIGKAGDKVTEIGSNVGKVGSRVNEAGTTVGRMGEHVVARDGKGLVDDAKQLGEDWDRITGTGKQVFGSSEKAAEAGSSGEKEDEGFDWKGELKDGAKELYGKVKDTMDDLPEPEQSAQDIDNNLTVGSGRSNYERESWENRPVY